MKLAAVVTAKQSALVNLNGLESCVQTNNKDLSSIAIPERMKLQKHCWEADHKFSWE